MIDRTRAMSIQLGHTARARIAPFMLFVALLALRGAAPTNGEWGFDTRWIYAGSLVGVGGLLLLWRREYAELSLQTLPDARELWLAVAVGLAVFALWIHMDSPWMTMGAASAVYAPLDAAGALDWPLVIARWLGAALVVPLIEELFWRSFLMRWIEHPVFQGVDPRRVGLRAIVLSTFVFTLAHTLWLAAVLAGLAYAWLYVRSGKLWLPVIAHVVTNAALGAWVVATRNWQFW